MSTQADEPAPRDDEDLRDPDDVEQTEDSTPAFDIDLEPEDQGTAEAAAEPSG